MPFLLHRQGRCNVLRKRIRWQEAIQNNDTHMEAISGCVYVTQQCLKTVEEIGHLDDKLRNKFKCF